MSILNQIGLQKKLSTPPLLLVLFIGVIGTSSPTFAQQKWRAVGSVGFSGGKIRGTDMAIDGNNVPYVVFSDNGTAYDGKVMKYDGSKWVTIGNFPQAIDMAITIDANNHPYVVFNDGSVGGKATVMKYNGSTWSVVGWAGLSALNVYHNDITIDKNNKPLITHLDDGIKSEVTAMRYNAGWWEIGMPSYTAVYWPIFQHIAVDGNNVPYVVFTHRNNNNKVTVIKYDGSKWVLVGPDGISGADSQFPDIAIDDNNIPYVVYRERDSSNKAVVKKYDGNKWVIVGGKAVSNGPVLEPRIAIDGNDVPYVVYDDGSDSGKAKVVRYEGSKWVNVGSSTDSASVGAIRYNSIAIDDNNIPYIAYLDHKESEKVTVMKYDFPASISDNNKQENQISVVPNPAHDYVNISYASAIHPTEINILNATGQVVHTQQVSHNSKSIKVALSNLPDGMYMVEVTTESGKYTSKLVKK